MSSLSLSQIEEMIQQLQSKKQTELEAQKSIVDIVRDRLEDQWTRVSETEERSYQISLEKYQKLILLEFSIIESAKTYVADDILESVAKVFSRIRISDDLKAMISVYPSVSKKSGEEKQRLLKIRNVMKLLSNVYRYNRDLLFDKKTTNHSTLKSNILYASACDHCGEVAKKILDNMTATGTVQLP
jgi:hypothetical protein